MAVVGLLAACDGGRGIPPGDKPLTRDASSDATTGLDAGSSFDALDLNDAVASADGSSFDAAASLDAASLDALAFADAASLDALAFADAASLDALPLPDAAPPYDAGPPAGEVNLTTQGCTADFSGDIVVAYNGSIGIASLQGSALSASLQFDLRGLTGTINLSTQHRVDTGLVVNLVTWSTWTNITQDPDVFSGQAPDPISGTLIVRQAQPAQGILDLELVGVTLENVSDHSLCTLNGSVVTTRLGR